MTDGRGALEHVCSGQPDGACLERYSRQAAQHQLRALTELARMDELPLSITSERRREFLLYALNEALMAWRLLLYAQQEAAGGETLLRLQGRQAKVSALVESIERTLDAPESVVHERAGP